MKKSCPKGSINFLLSTRKQNFLTMMEALDRNFIIILMHSQRICADKTQPGISRNLIYAELETSPVIVSSMEYEAIVI